MDHTPPDLINITANQREPYQLQDDHLDIHWECGDPESGVAEYRLVVLEQFQGRQTKFWPEAENAHVIRPTNSSPSSTTVNELHLSALGLQNGATYTVKVTAINVARMATVGESEGTTIDTTPPIVRNVSLV